MRRIRAGAVALVAIGLVGTGVVAAPSAHAATGDPTAGCIANDSFLSPPVGSMDLTSTPPGAPSALPIPPASKVAPGDEIDITLTWDDTDWADIDSIFNCVRTGINTTPPTLTETFRANLSYRQDDPANDGELVLDGGAPDRPTLKVPLATPGGTFICARGVLVGTPNAPHESVQKTARRCYQVHTKPFRPVNVNAVAGDATATVSWASGGDGGESLIDYTITSSPGNITKVVPANTTSVKFTGLQNNTKYTFTVRTRNSLGASGTTLSNTVVPSKNSGFWIAARDGGIFSFGDAAFHGSTGSLRLNRPIVGMTGTPTGNGYWFVAADGGIFAYGDAGFYGSTGSLKLNQPIVGMTANPNGRGYWFVASDGGVFSFGDAKFYGSMGGIKLNQPIVGMSTTPSGRGYWLVARDGGIFSFGDAKFYGSTGSLKLNQPIVGMTNTPTGKGYRFVAADGGIFSFGDAKFYGSVGGAAGGNSVVGMARTRSGAGYWLVTRSGRIYAFGNAVKHGDLTGVRLNQPIVGMSSD
jgi:hypothetical protein